STKSQSTAMNIIKNCLRQFPKVAFWAATPEQVEEVYKEDIKWAVNGNYAQTMHDFVDTYDTALSLLALSSSSSNTNTTSTAGITTTINNHTNSSSNTTRGPLSWLSGNNRVTSVLANVTNSNTTTSHHQNSTNDHDNDKNTAMDLDNDDFDSDDDDDSEPTEYNIPQIYDPTKGKMVEMPWFYTLPDEQSLVLHSRLNMVTSTPPTPPSHGVSSTSTFTNTETPSTNSPTPVLPTRQLSDFSSTSTTPLLNFHNP
ncbi:hypothetical protein HDU76_009554, partial [Blyttiomyces sp. JEL0837]